MPSTTDSAVCIVNTAAGSAGEGLVDKLRAISNLRTVMLEKGQDGAEVARGVAEAGARQIVVCGGDGSVMAAVNGIMASGRDIELGIVPAGTANLVAGALGLPSDEDEALDVALSGSVREIDLGFCDGHYFALGLGIGAAERFVSEVESSQKRKLGPVAYLWSLVRQIGSSRVGTRVRVDGRELVERAVAVTVLNAGHAGGDLKPIETVSVDDGLLDVVVVRRFELKDALRMAFRAIRGQLHEDSAVATYQGRIILVETAPHHCVQIDGDEVDCKMPLEIRAVPSAIRVRVPTKNGVS